MKLQLNYLSMLNLLNLKDVKSRADTISGNRTYVERDLTLFITYLYLYSLCTLKRTKSPRIVHRYTSRYDRHSRRALSIAIENARREERE